MRKTHPNSITDYSHCPQKLFIPAGESLISILLCIAAFDPPVQNLNFRTQYQLKVNKVIENILITQIQFLIKTKRVSNSNIGKIKGRCSFLMFHAAVMVKNLKPCH